MAQADDTIYTHTMYMTDLSHGDRWVHHQLNWLHNASVNDVEYSEHPKMILSQVGELLYEWIIRYPNSLPHSNAMFDET